MTVKITLLFTCLLATTVSAFVVAPSTKKHHSFVTLSEQKKGSTFDPLDLSSKTTIPTPSKAAIISASTAAILSSSPLVALAEESDDYEYGAVDAPIGIAVGGGLLAILTALLPIALKGGEEAFEEMKDRDSDQWGTGSTGTLDKRKR